MEPVIDWIRAWGTPEGRLDPGGELQQGHMVRMYARVSDDQTPTQSLEVEISCRCQGGEWMTHAATYMEAKDYFCYDLNTQGAEPGTYDVKVDVNDPVGGGSSTDTDANEFNIVSAGADPVIDWVKAWGTPEGRLDLGGDVSQGNMVRIYARIHDDQISAQSLEVEVRYRRQGGSWTTQTASYLDSKDYFYYDLNTASVEPGMYDVKIDAVHPIGGGSTFQTDTGEFNVVSVAGDPVIAWIKAWGTPEGRLDPGGEVEKGHMVRMYTRVTDVDTPYTSLDVSISYKPQGGTWTQQSATYLEAKNYWCFDLNTQEVASGVYDLQVEVSDPEEGYATKTELDEFRVV